MDQRQPPPHSFSRSTASPYGRNPFPPSSNQAPFPPSSHPPNATPSYADHQRRPSDPPFYNSQRSYGQDGPPMAGPSHSRHQSASSIGHGTPVNRGMPPPSSPQQGPQQQQHSNYGPPPPRAPPLSVGPPSSFPSGRELPALGQRGGMSISDILGGPPSSREPTSQYGSPIATSGPPNSTFGPSHASPRVQSTGPDYAPFRRPQTPEHQRSYAPRDHRANSAGSPPGVSHYSTPEARQFGTPYRGPAAEERREPVRVPNPNTIPPRPNSQPNSYNPPPHRAPDSRPPPNDFGRRVENVGHPPEPLNRFEPPYQRPGFEERQDPRYGYGERERQDREREAAMQREIQREREQRELRQQRERAEQERHQEYAHQLAQRNAQAYNRAPEREQPAWMRPGYGESRPSYEQPAERPPPQQPPNGYEYPGTTAPQYGGHPAYASSEPRNDHRYAQASQPPPHNPVPASQYETSMQERQQRVAHLQQQQQQQPAYSVLGQNTPYQSHELPVRRTMEDPQQMQQQRTFLGVQEINRKGRVSPLPQAVQGAQGQMSGPGGEASIKNEFGRMFSGIGSGVGSAMGVPSPITAGPQSIPFSNTGQLRRDDVDSLQNSPTENGGHKIQRTASRGGRRRKLKEEDSKGDDESSTGRHTPSGRGKRAKTFHHHHHHHHHHRPDPQENTSSPNLTPFKSIKGSAIPSPPGPDKEIPNPHHHHVPVSRPHHHHHHGVAARPPIQINPQVPLQNVTIHSNAVLDQVKNLPRHHLGHGYYEPALKPSSSVSAFKKGSRGYESTPKPLPRFDDTQLNCIYTVKVPCVHLAYSSLKEITRRKALWGTDIYTDDSDVIAACVHQGWFRGAWDESVDISLLGLELAGEPLTGSGRPNTTDKVMMRPPPTGPEDVPKYHDVHVDIVVLPTLESYGSTIRFGIKSREWGYKRESYQSEHDGMSFMILKVQFVSGVNGEVGRGGMERRKLFAKKLEEEELVREMTWSDLLQGQGEIQNGSNFQESFERGGLGPLTGDIKGVGTNSWWKKSNGVTKDREKAKEVKIQAAPVAEAPRTPPRGAPRHYVPIDPPIPSPISVVDPQNDVERVTELMIENANTAETPVTEAAVEELFTQESPGQESTLTTVTEARELGTFESEREVNTEGNGLGGNLEVNRETLGEEAALKDEAEPPVEDAAGSQVPAADTEMSGTRD